MFCEHYFLAHIKNIGSVGRYIHTCPFQGSFFHSITLFLKVFFLSSDLLKPSLEKKAAKKNVNKS